MSVQALLELFEEYKKHPRKEWIEDYRKTCEKVRQIANREIDLEVDYAKFLWTSRENGIAGIREQALLTSDEFDTIQSELTSITHDIFEDPSPDNYKKTIEYWDKFKDDGHVGQRRFASTSRIFAAVAPTIYSSVISIPMINHLIRYLKNNHSITIPRGGDWADKNSRILAKIKESHPVFQNANPYVLNTFIWWLYDEHIQPAEQTPQDDANMSSQNDDQPSEFTISALNTIFYGPPGTGKTYRTQQLKEEYKTAASKLTQEQWADEIFGEPAWWKVIAAVLYDKGGKLNVPQIKEHPFVLAKLRACENNNLNQTIWRNLQVHALEDSKTVKYKKRRSPFIFDKTPDSVWELQEGWEEMCEDIISLVKKYNAGQQSDKTINRYEFVTFHQSYSYEEFIEGIRPVLKDEAQKDSIEGQNELEYELVDGVFKRICNKARNNPEEDYAIFIDEINRGNISKIFGELITLIEEDKRRDYTKPEPNGLEVKLPYSQKSFSVPKNLHIIGTMNTADRSLALMDTALRRRFSFVEAMPKPELIKNPKVTNGSLTVDIVQLLTALNERIEALYDREHTLGHAFFMGPQWKVPSMNVLKETFKQKIIPLLQEYFFDDWEKIRLVLGDNQKEPQKGNQFITKTEINNSSLFGDAEINGFELNKFEINDEAFDKIEAYIQIYSPKQKSQEPEA